MPAKMYKMEAFEDEKRDELEDMNPQKVRDLLGEAVKGFKSSWRSLAKVLYFVWKEKLYKRWGYDKFDSFTAKEAKVRKHTAMKLIRSYMFLEREGFCESATGEAPGGEISLEAASTLEKAKRSLDEGGYSKIRQDLIDSGRDPGEVKKDLTAFMRQRRNDVDPERERTRQGNTSISRIISTLRSFRREVEILKILPGDVCGEIDSLIGLIEKYRGYCKN